MNLRLRQLSALALATALLVACRTSPPPRTTGEIQAGAADKTSASARAVAPSPRLLVGRVLAVDLAQRVVIVDVARQAPADALLEGAELSVRTLDLRETARLRSSRHVRGRTLGTTLVSGQPSPGDEVVWLAP